MLHNKVRHFFLLFSMIVLLVNASPALTGNASVVWQWYKTDPHVHSSVSAEAYVDLGIISQSAENAGYDGIFLTDHNGASSFQINNMNANHMAFNDTYTRWSIGNYGALNSTVNALAASPVRSGAYSLRLKSASSSYGKSFVWTKRGPNFRSGDVTIHVSIYPTRIDPGSGVYVSVALGGDPTVVKDPYGYTTKAGVISPGKTTVLVWQLGDARGPSGDPNARVQIYSLGSYQLNAWNDFTIDVSKALNDIPAADLPLDYNGLVNLKMAAAGNGGTAEAYFDAYSIDDSSPVDPANEYVYRTSQVSQFNTQAFTIFPSYEMGQQRHTQRFNFGITDPADYRSYTSGSDGIADTHDSGYPTQVNHPGVTITTDEVIQNKGMGSDFMEVREQTWADTWDAVLNQGVIILGQWSSDTHTAGFSGKPATYIYAPLHDFDALIHSMYEGLTYSARADFTGRILFNLDTGSQEPYPARYPVFVSDALSSADVHLEVTGGLRSGDSIEWIRDAAQIASDSTKGASYNSLKNVSLSSSFTYVRAQVRQSNGDFRGMTQPIVFKDVAGMPAEISFHVNQVTTLDNRWYNVVFTKGITDASWNDAKQILWAQLENPAGALVEMQIGSPSKPASIMVDNAIVNDVGSQSTYDQASGAAWYYDINAQKVRLKVVQGSGISSVLVEFSAKSDTLPPSVPTGLTVVPLGMRQADLSWTASTDNTGVQGYTIYRDGVELAVVNGGATTYSDTTTAASASYTYTIDAFDPYGNHSAPSDPVSVIMPAESVLTFTVAADTYVNSASPTRNYGTSSALRADVSPDVHAYLLFNLNGVSGLQVQSAVLNLYSNSSSSFGLKAYAESDTSWGERTMTYENAPATGEALGVSGAISAGAWASLDVTPVVQSDGPLSLAIFTDSNTALSFASRESGTNAATLTVTLTMAGPATVTPAVTETAAPTSTATPTTGPSPTPTSTATPTTDPSPLPTDTPTSTPLPTDAPTPTPLPATLILTPAADAYTNASNPNSNYGSSTSFRLDSSPLQVGYVRFDVPDLGGQQIVGAQLLFYANSGSASGYELMQLADTNWDESSITYNTAPAAGGLLGAASPFSSGFWVTIDVTSYVTGAGPLGFVLNPISSTAINLSSKEGANPPELTLQLGP